MIRMTAIVSSMVGNLLRARGAVSPFDCAREPESGSRGSRLPSCSSNGCATVTSRIWSTRLRLFVTAAQVVGVIAINAELARAQDAPSQPTTQSVQSTASTAGLFLLGGGVAFVAHESGHLLFDAIFDANPGV